jgi:hypothetical protein
MLSATHAASASAAPTSAAAPRRASFRSTSSVDLRRRPGPPWCIDGRAGRCCIARAAPAGGAGGAGGPAPPSRPDAAVGRDRSVAAAAAAAAAALLAPASASGTDDIAVTGIAGTFASYEDPADAPRLGARRAAGQRLLLEAVGAEGSVSLPDEAARLSALLERLRACGGDASARLAVLEADARVIALREATR